ncbi:MAG: amidohydrolase family protein [Deltaproteobacteria bacterium]|nr:amidohydrolase family protein [Deltaproteobacteria bacterium]
MKRIAIALGVTAVVFAAAGLALYAALLPPRIPVPEQRDRVFHNVTLLEPGSPARPRQTLRIEGGRIASIEADSGDAVEATGLEGLYVTPGLIDMHVHYPPKVALGNAELWSLLFLAHGVTGLRETGSIDGSIFDVRAAIERGEAPGPRIFTCGRMLDGPRPSFPSNLVITTPGEAHTAVRDQAAAGADCIKAYNMLAAPVLAAIVDEAASLGLPVIGHVPHSVDFEEAGLVSTSRRSTAWTSAGRIGRASTTRASATSPKSPAPRASPTPRPS